MLKLNLVIVLIIICAGCDKSDNGTGRFSGIYQELSPQAMRTQLDFVSSNTVIVSGGRLKNQSVAWSGTDNYQITNGSVVFMEDSSGVKDTIRFYFRETGKDTLALTTCPLNVPCYSGGLAYTFKK